MRKLSRPAAGVVAAIAFAAALAAVAAYAPSAAAADKAFMRAERAVQEGDFEAAEKIYRDLLAKNQHDTAARLGLSRALLKQRKNQEAFDHAARVIAREPESSRAHALLGAALLGSGDFRLSVEEFRTALTFRDDEAIAIAGLAMVDFYENRIPQSLSGLRRAAFIDPNEPDYIYNLGQVAARSERYAEAADAYERFLRVAPKTDADRRARIRGLIDFLRYLGTQRDLLAVGGPGAVTFPFELVNNRAIVRVRVNGSKETLRFVVDTGAGMCVISTKAADRLNLKPVARGGLARAVGGEGRFEIVYGFLQSLQMGDAKVERVPVYIRQFFNDQEPVDGYIGLSVLGKYVTVVDYGARTMSLLRDDDAREASAAAALKAGVVEVPIRTTSSGFWSGGVSFDGLEKPANFIIDTGASISVVSEALAARAGLVDRFAQSARIRVYGAAGLAENIQTILLPRIELGAYSWRNVYAAVLDMEPINETAGFEQTGIVGGNILSRYRVTFDFPRGFIRLEPLAGAPKPDDQKATPVVTSQS
ncbi:MAG TPA: aspartyl protease family protein [Pyrinomonadaceae bacterium]|nr:aspartyl protease family protein [Pyrinomonadaceae bacterium]